MTPPPFPTQLLADLDIAVLERTPSGTFALLGTPPHWLSHLWPATNQAEAPLYPEEVFLFLECFMPDAQAFWDDPQQAGYLSSGPWTEVDAEGHEWLLEAVAMRPEGRSVLLIKPPTIDHHAFRHLLQTGREQHLAYHQLLKEIDKREVLLHCIIHDLSTPLAGLKGSLRLLYDDSATSSESQELLSLGLRQVEKLQQLIREILGSFRRQATPLLSPMRLLEAKPDLLASAREVTAALTAAAALKNVALHVEAEGDPAAPWDVVGEAARLERILFNLIENALRHTRPDTTVFVRLRRENTFLHCRVEDEGPGIPAGFESRIFDKFTQGSGETGHTGLGLYFCRITIEGWGGQIGYQPLQPGGACFWFKLPQPSAA